MPQLRHSPAVYPRVCGGTVVKVDEELGIVGLSPRVRGNRVDGGQHFIGKGSIPACAGEPICAHISSVASAVYPRVCGGTSSRASA